MATGTGRVSKNASSSASVSLAADAVTEASPLATGIIMRTVALAPRFRRNGSGSLSDLGGSLELIGVAVGAMGGAVEIRGAPDDSTAGKPIIVFLRGGLEE